MQIRFSVRHACVFAMLVQPLIPVSPAAAQNSEHRYAGLVFDPFVRKTSSGEFEAWTAEEGGRIRYRSPSTGLWSFQTTPDEVKDTLHRIHFLPAGPDGQIGWAVGNNGWVLKTTNGGGTWSVIARIAELGFSPSGWEELYDVHFLNPLEGWLIGKHTFKYSTDGGLNWWPLIPYGGGLPWLNGHTNEALREFVWAPR